MGDTFFLTILNIISLFDNKKTTIKTKLAAYIQLLQCCNACAMVALYYNCDDEKLEKGKTKKKKKILLCHSFVLFSCISLLLLSSLL
jgi:uncharacterized membrane protein YadS